MATTNLGAPTPPDSIKLPDGAGFKGALAGGLSGAATMASTGNPWAMGAGALVGTVSSLINTGKQRELMQKLNYKAQRDHSTKLQKLQTQGDAMTRAEGAGTGYFSNIYSAQDGGVIDDMRVPENPQNVGEFKFRDGIQVREGEVKYLKDFKHKLINSSPDSAPLAHSRFNHYMERLMPEFDQEKLESLRNTLKDVRWGDRNDVASKFAQDHADFYISQDRAKELLGDDYDDFRKVSGIVSDTYKSNYKGTDDVAPYAVGSRYVSMIGDTTKTTKYSMNDRDIFSVSTDLKYDGNTYTPEIKRMLNNKEAFVPYDVYKQYAAVSSQKGGGKLAEAPNFMSPTSLNDEVVSMVLKLAKDVGNLKKKAKEKEVPKVKIRYQDGGVIKDLEFDKWLESLPDNLKDTDPALYDLRGAFEAGLNPELDQEDGTYHLASRNPKTGRILKSPKHETFREAIEADRDLGYFPYIDSEGNIHTFRKDEVPDGFTPYELQSAYRDGGRMNVVPKGVLHARKNKIGDKGIPVVFKEEDGTFKKVAEIEKDEIIFTLEVTRELEKYADKLENGTITDEELVSVGKMVQEEVTKNTIDNTKEVIK